ncbi:translesion error-prone DNA polymerase V autoproteolytic subunit [soil metagenome]
MPTIVETVYFPERATSLARPLFTALVPAGSPVPLADYIEGRLDLNRHLIKHPTATFFVRVAGDSMLGAGIHPGDILVVDRALEAQDRQIVIAVVDGELTVKRLSRLPGGRMLLLPDNDAYQPLEIQSGMEFEVWGVVTAVVHHL